MDELFVFHAAIRDPAGRFVGGFHDEVLLSLDLPRGRYVINARVTMGNNDGDAQNAAAGLKLRSSLSGFLDRVDFRLAGAAFGTQTIALQAVLDIPEGNEFLDLTAGSFQAGTWWPTIIAQQVREFVPPLF